MRLRNGYEYKEKLERDASVLDSVLAINRGRLVFEGNDYAGHKDGV